MPERQEAPGAAELAPHTSTTLLEGLRDPGNGALWEAYVARYRPVIVGYARRAGVAPEDAEDLAQASLFAFSKAYCAGEYRRAQGRLRSWLFGIVRNCLRGSRRARAEELARRAATADGARAVQELAGEREQEQLWEREWRAAVLAECLRQASRELEPATVEAFRLHALQGWEPARVAAHLGLSTNAVYGAKRRVLRRIRELAPLMEDVF